MRSFPIVSLLLVLAACSSTPSADGADGARSPLRITLTQWHNGQYFELVNDSYLAEVEAQSRVELYSSVRSDAQRKVQADDVSAELMAKFDELGFDDLANPGHAPAPKVGAETGWSIEVEDASGVRFALTFGREADDRIALLSMIQAFFEIWNNTFSLQSVEVEPGESPFKQPTPPGQ